MNATEYQSGVLAAATAAAMISETDLPKILSMIERADSFGAVLDPTLYREKHQAMMEDKELLEAALPLWKVGQVLKARARDAKKALQKNATIPTCTCGEDDEADPLKSLPHKTTCAKSLGA
jgi:hypothetical protein